MPTAPRASNAAAAADSGMLCSIDHGRHAGRRAQLGEIAGETVGHIHRRAGVIAHRRAPARCAAAARGSGRPASALAAASCASAAAAAPPFRISRPSAASPIVPVTTTRSPGLRAAATDHLARRHAAERGDRDHQRPRRRNRIAAEQRAAEQAGVLAERRARTAPASHRPASRSASVSTKPAGVAPLAARSDRFTRSALRAMVSGGSSGRKCTPSTMASVVTTMSSPLRLAGSPHHRPDRTRRDRSRAAGNSARSGSLRRTDVSAIRSSSAVTQQVPSSPELRPGDPVFQRSPADRPTRPRHTGSSAFADDGNCEYVAVAHSTTPAKTRRRETGGRSGRAPR